MVIGVKHRVSKKVYLIWYLRFINLKITMNIRNLQVLMPDWKRVWARDMKKIVKIHFWYAALFGLNGQPWNSSLESTLLNIWSKINAVVALFSIHMRFSHETSLCCKSTYLILGRKLFTLGQNQLLNPHMKI